MDRFIANNTELSRSDAQRAIKRRWVSVNGKIITNIADKVSDQDKILLDDRLICIYQPQYLMLYKPAGYVCTQVDDTHPSIFTLIDTATTIPDTSTLHVAGRLDQDTTGLVIITDDGAWSHKITSPRHKKAKIYIVELAHPITEAAVKQLEEGVQLRNEKALTAPATVEVLSPQQIKLTITEGKYHQVKRMLAAVSNRITGLHREQIGSLLLDSTLKPGELRPLTENEFKALS